MSDIRRLDAQRVRIAALHREWEQTEVDAPGGLRALVRLWEAQAAYVTTLRLDRQLHVSLAGDGMRRAPHAGEAAQLLGCHRITACRMEQAAPARLKQLMEPRRRRPQAG